MQERKISIRKSVDVTTDRGKETVTPPEVMNGHIFLGGVAVHSIHFGRAVEVDSGIERPILEPKDIFVAAEAPSVKGAKPRLRMVKVFEISES